ncbi:hypothetical protein GA0074692_1262 [Micromonospora pallida]|uniref:Uncharacterized protein n=1 Tax=Micromonospora pallida TaxID=145854 RepID=A0A1C6RX87_9ACTN|nr:hypothetical protein [Micromonospora pallida]SCL21817.1 hypothetical protein GA0074692_1262 [Micromonospora pallida]
MGGEVGTVVHGRGAELPADLHGRLRCRYGPGAGFLSPAGKGQEEAEQAGDGTGDAE